MEWVESTGSTIEEAKERALDRLGVHGDDAEFEIVSDVVTGLFGRVKQEARVRARVAPATSRAGDARRRGRGDKGRNNQRNRSHGRGEKQQSNRGKGSRPGNDNSRVSGGGKRKNGKGWQQKSDNRNASRREGRGDKMSDSDTGEAPEEMVPLPEQAEMAEEFVLGLAERFGTSVEFTREKVDDDEIRITVSGTDLGRMIGRRGATAGAIDDLVRMVLQRRAGSSRNGRIRVDIAGVRERRAAALKRYSREQGAAVRASGKQRALEPMSASDRKVVHDALSDEPGVDTISEGENAQRHIVIVPTGSDD